MSDLRPRLTDREFERLYSGTFPPSDERGQICVDVSEFLHRIEDVQNAVIEAGARYSDLAIVMSERDYNSLSRAAGDTTVSVPGSTHLKHSIPRVILSKDYPDGRVVIINSAIPFDSYIIDIPTIYNPVIKQDNSPMLGGKTTPITGNEQMLGSKEPKDE